MQRVTCSQVALIKDMGSTNGFLNVGRVYNILMKYLASLAGFGFIVLVLSGFALAHSGRSASERMSG